MSRFGEGEYYEKIITNCIIYFGWHENGQKDSEQTFKDGKKHGLVTYWYDNGQKWKELTYKDGELDGLVTVWYENGQKERETTYKDGEEISEKKWDR